MGLFKQLKDAKKATEAAPDLVQGAMQMQAQAQQMMEAQQAALEQQAAEQEAARQAAPPGPDLEPIAGVSLELFAEVCKGLAAHGYDQSKAADIAAAKGVKAADWQQALDGWNARVKANPAVAQRFNAYYQAA